MAENPFDPSPGDDGAIRIFHDYALWESCARARGFQGPYQLIGNPPGEQFVYGAGGTAAIWNAAASRGTVFEVKSE